jgi:hypothetical protein
LLPISITHIPDMRTSIDLNETLLAEAKRIAVEQHTTLKAVIEDALRGLIAAQRAPRLGEPGGWPVNYDARPRPGVDLTRTSALDDLTDAP